MKFIIIVAALGILASLGSALFFMLRKPDQSASSPEAKAIEDARRSQKMLRALSWRVALSVVLFLGILVAAKLGYLQPTGWRPGQ